jgi:hypothetical protein
MKIGKKIKLVSMLNQALQAFWEVALLWLLVLWMDFPVEAKQLGQSVC